MQGCSSPSVQTVLKLRLSLAYLRGLYLRFTCMLASYGRLFRTWYSGLDSPQQHSVATDNQRWADSFQFTQQTVFCTYSCRPSISLRMFCLSVCLSLHRNNMWKTDNIFTKFWCRPVQTPSQLNVAVFFIIGQEVRTPLSEHVHAFA
jgi:hypothetical protein